MLPRARGPTGWPSSPRRASRSTSIPASRADVFMVPDGEGAKSLDAGGGVCAGTSPARACRRSDAVVAVGGGVVTDLAGFAAAVVPPGHRLRERGHHPAGPGRRGHRGQDGRQPARGQEPGRRLLAAGRRPLRHRRPVHPAAPGVGVGPGRDGQVRLSGRCLPGSARPCGPAPRGAGGPAAWPSRPRWWRPTSGSRIAAWSSTTGTPWPTPWRRPPSVPTPGDLRHGEAVAVGLVFAAQLARRLGRIDDAAWPCTARWSAASTSPPSCPGRADAGQLVVLHGPRQEGPPRPDLRPRRPPAGWSRSTAWAQDDVVATLTEMGCAP